VSYNSLQTATKWTWAYFLGHRVNLQMSLRKNHWMCLMRKQYIWWFTIHTRCLWQKKTFCDSQINRQWILWVCIMMAVHASELNRETCPGSSGETGEVLELISVSIDMFCNLETHACLLYPQERCLASTLCNARHQFIWGTYSHQVSETWNLIVGFKLIVSAYRYDTSMYLQGHQNSLTNGGPDIICIGDWNQMNVSCFR
jgi:hypothetical protein